MLDEATRDRARGALLGLAVGDALGTTLEFSPRDSQSLQTEITGGGPFGLQPGQWTDDTSMALALADSLIQSCGLDPRDLAERFVAWWKQGAFSATGHCFDIGVTTAEALGQFRANGNPMAGSTDENAAGNGSVMRLAPVVLATLGHPSRRTEWAAGQSRVTHGAPQALEGCVWFAELLARAIGGEPKEQLLAPDQGGDRPALRALHRAEWATKERAEIRSSGYVVHTLEAALWSVSRTDSFEDALILAVNLGEDSDTVGAVTGQLAGALYGLSAIPKRWLAPLFWRSEISRSADVLLAMNDA